MILLIQELVEISAKSLIEAMQDPVMVLDSRGRIVAQNAACRKLLGHALEDIVGKHMLDCVLASTYSGKELRSAKRSFSAAIKEDKGFIFEYKSASKNGKPIHVLLSGSMLMGAKKRTTHIIALLRNITERKKAKKALEESENLFRDLTESTSDWIWEVNSEGVYTLVSGNIKSILGYTEEEILGRTPFDLMPSEEREKILSIFSEISIKKERIVDLENWNLHKDGQLVCLLTNGVPILDEEGNLLGYRGVDKDITERRRAEKELRKLAMVAEQTRDGIAVADMDGIIEYTNRAWADMHGYRNPKELIGENLSIFHTEEQLEQDVIPFNEKLKEIGEYQGEVGHKRMDGTTFPAFMNNSIMKDEEGNPIALIGVAHDITDRKRAEDALRESEEKYRTILENIEDGYYEVDLSGNLTFFNKSLCRILGYSEDVLMGMNYLQYVDGETVEGVFKTFNAVYRTGKSAKVIDWTIIRTDGIRRSIETSVSLVVDSAGEPAGFRGIARDVTERMEAQKALKDSEERYKGLVERMNEVVCRISVPDGKFEYMSPSVGRLVGYNAEEFLNNPLLFVKIVHPDSLEYFMGKWVEMVEGKVDPLLEYKIMDTTGHTKWVAHSNIPVYDNKGNFIALEGICRDISDRKKAEEDMKSAAETAMLYLDLMGHDIRNHLQAIVMGTEILEQLDIRPEVREMADIVGNSVENSQNLIRKVQATRGLLSVPLSNISLRKSLEDCVQVLNQTYDDVQIEVNLGSQQPTVFADKYVRTLLMNILENAILHNDKKTKRVWLSLREAKGGYEVVIADNGPGIDNDEKEHLFDQSRRFGGVGVHQAFKIVEKYGGHIGVQDRVPGDLIKGTEFHIWFPKSTP